jgi:hypothetical protein
MPTLNTSTSGNTFLATLTSFLEGTCGWTRSGAAYPYTFTNPVGADRLVRIRLDAISAQYFTFTVLNGDGATKTLYCFHGTTTLTDNFTVTMYGGPTHFFIVAEGPGPSAAGAANATTGSPRSHFGVFPIVPYSAADLPLGQLLCAFSSSAGANTTSTDQVFVGRGITGTAWQTARLLTMRPTVASLLEGTVPANPRSKFAPDAEGRMLWPLVVNEESGTRGRLDGIWYGSYAYNSAADISNGQSADGQLYVNNVLHNRVSAQYIPGVDAYSPLGRAYNTTTGASNVTDGGPYVFVNSAT